jgi:thioredoxin reductase (NADPH)
MTGPVLLAVEEDDDALRQVQAELEDRYGRHYRVCCTSSALEARAWLEELAATRQPVALILAGQWLTGLTGSELLDEARHLHPHAKRVLLIEWGTFGNPETGEAIFHSIAHGRIDHYVLRPAAPPDEQFHYTVSGLLLDWAEAQRSYPYSVHIVGESWTGRAYELREALGRCALPHTFCLADSTIGQSLLAAAGPDVRLPIMVMPNGHVLQNPTNVEIAIAVGTSVSPERSDFDLVIVGAGPAGLSAAVYGASEGFRTLVVDDAGIGGQSTSSSLIRNYLGFPRGLSGRSLAQRAYEQAWIFGADFALMQRAADLRSETDGVSLALSDFGRVHARAVVLATGASYNRLGLPRLEALNGAGVFYGGPSSETPAMADRDVYVLGGANSAGQAALYLSRFARRVTLVVRSGALDVGMSRYLVREVAVTPNVRVRLSTDIVDGAGDGWLEHLTLRDRATGREETVDAGGLFVMIGASPHTEWLPRDLQRDAHGFVLTGTDLERDTWPLDRSPFLLETSMPNVFAIGDARHGAGRRVASAVGEGAVAVQLLHQLFAADQRQPRGRPKAAAPAGMA